MESQNQPLKPKTASTQLSQSVKFRQALKHYSFFLTSLPAVFALLIAFNSCSNTDNKLLPPEKEKQEEKEVEPLSIYQGPPVLHFSHRENSYTAFIFNTSKFKIEFFYQNERNEKYHTIKKVKEVTEERGEKLLFATNAGIYDPNHHPVGLLANKGKELAPLNTKDGKGNFFLKPNGVFFMRDDGSLGISETDQYQKDSISVQYATQSGPLLLNHGEIHPAFNEGSPNRLVRNGVGIISPSEAVFMISNGPVNFFDFSMAFKEQFNCQDALYLDGVISQVYLPELGGLEREQSFSGMIGVWEISPLQ